MRLFDKLKSIFADTPSPAPEQVKPAVLAVEEPDTPSADEMELLDKLTRYSIVDAKTMALSALQMRVYRFSEPFDAPDLLTIIRGMRWLGFRLYQFSASVDSTEHECESWQEFVRLLSENTVEQCSLLCAFCGVRVNCVLSSDGVIHLSHDSSRGVDFTPFEELFSPEEAPESES